MRSATRTSALLLALASLLITPTGSGAQPDPAPPNEEQRAAAALEEAGARIGRDERAPGRPVDYVSFREPFKAEALKSLKALPKLKTLSFEGEGAVTDAGLAHVQGLNRLETLEIADSPVTDAGLAHLAGLNRLETLTLSRAKVTDAGLAHLQGFPRLESLTLNAVAVSGPGLAHLKTLPRLRWLVLSHLPLTDAGLAHLGGPPSLESLNLSEVPVTDAGLASLKRLPRLRTVFLFDMRLTDAALAKAKEALPYALIYHPDRAPRAPRQVKAPAAVPFRLGAFAALGLGAILCLCARPWRPTPRNPWLWKLPFVLAPMLLVADELQRLAPRALAMKDGDPAAFWMHACRVDVGVDDAYLCGSIYLPRDGWFIYYMSGIHGQTLYRVKAEEALALFPRVVKRLQDAPPGALDPDVEQGYQAWARHDPKQADAEALLVKIRGAQLARLRRENRELHDYALDCDEAFAERWHRVQHYGRTLAFEFCFLAGLILFAAWPWLRGGGPVRWAVHLGLVPLLFCLPYWLGYAPLTFTSAPSGGVLYPRLLSPLRDWGWTGIDVAVVRVLPQFLEPLSQTPGPMMSMSRMGGVGPSAVLMRSVVLGALVFAVGLALRHRRQVVAWAVRQVAP